MSRGTTWEAAVRILATTSRMPFAVEEIRQLGERGHEVTAADTFAAAAGSHSRGAARHEVVPSPVLDTAGFIDAVSRLLDEFSVEVVLPMFEDVFYLARHRDRLEGWAELFFPDFDTLARVHDKATFTALAGDLSLPVAETVLARTDAELRDAIGRLDRYFARAAFSRGGVELLTNTGPLAGDVAVEDCHPSEQNPWLVQAFVDGVDHCSWSVVRHGTVVLHATYVHPLTIDGAGGIVFESVDTPPTLEAAQAVAAATGWHGQLSFDYLRSDDGVFHMVECNPRPTDGCTLATPEELDTALFGPVPDEPVVVPAGRSRQIAVAVVRDMVRHWSEIPRDVHELLRAGRPVYADPHDLLPLIWSVGALGHVRAYRRELGLGHHHRKDLVNSQFFDVSWDGAPIP